jgi:hypothetical protein
VIHDAVLRRHVNIEKLNAERLKKANGDARS